MDLQKEREAFQKFCEKNFDFENHEQTYFDEQTQCYVNDIGEDTESINMAWMAWQARAQAVPEGFVLVERTDLECAIDALKWASNEDSDLCAKQAGVLEDVLKAQELTND